MNALYGAQTRAVASLFSCRLAQYSLDVLAAAWQAKLQVLCVCLCLCLRVRGAVWKAHVQHSESHYTITDCHGELKAGLTWRQWSGNIINATMLWSTLDETCGHRTGRMRGILNATKQHFTFLVIVFKHSLNEKLSIVQMYCSDWVT